MSAAKGKRKLESIPPVKESAKSKDPLALIFLEHTARETVWMRHHAKECNYQAAAAAEIRRGVWAHAALLAQEHKR